jgi:hypothetical protein
MSAGLHLDTPVPISRLAARLHHSDVASSQGSRLRAAPLHEIGLGIGVGLVVQRARSDTHREIAVLALAVRITCAPASEHA